MRPGGGGMGRGRAGGGAALRHSSQLHRQYMPSKWELLPVRTKDVVRFDGGKKHDAPGIRHEFRTSEKISFFPIVGHFCRGEPRRRSHQTSRHVGPAKCVRTRDPAVGTGSYSANDNRPVCLRSEEAGVTRAAARHCFPTTPHNFKVPISTTTQNASKTLVATASRTSTARSRTYP
jgi:hypothetical protein